MGTRSLVGIKLRCTPAEVCTAVSTLKSSLEPLGIEVEGWHFDVYTGVLILHVRCPPGVLKEVEEVIAGSLNGAGLGCEISRIGEKGTAEVAATLPGPQVLGFLARLADLRELPVTPKELTREEVFALVAHYLSGFDLSTTLLTASFLGLEPSTIECSLRKLAEAGYLSRDLSSLESRGEYLLDSLIPRLRVTLRGLRAPEIRAGALKALLSLPPLELSEQLSLRAIGELEKLHTERIPSRLLDAILSSIFDEILPGYGAAEWFSTSPHLSAIKNGRFQSLTPKYLREISASILGERGLHVPPQLASTLARVLLRWLKWVVALAPWRFESCALSEDEIRGFAQLLAPLVSAAWLELAYETSEALRLRYMLRSIGYLTSAVHHDDFSEARRFSLRAAALLSSSLLLSFGTLPSNFASVNVQLLKSRLAKDIGGGKTEVIRQLLALFDTIVSTPSVASPSEKRRALTALKELWSLTTQLTVG